GSSRSPKMRDVLATIQADQDAIIRAESQGSLVVDGGPGTGKTVVALHRAAYLLYADPRVSRQRGGVLFIGPSAAYLSYVADILPNLGEDGVQTCTLRNLLPEGDTARPETNQDAARLKSSAELIAVIESAVAGYELPPRRGMTVETEWADVWLDPRDWAEAFASAEPGTPHNEAREQVWEHLLTIVLDQHDDEEVPLEEVRRSLLRNRELRSAFTRAWPLLDPVGVVADLFSVPAYLEQCAPWLSPDERAALLRSDGRAWTASDLPLLDAARFRIGDPESARRDRQRDAALAAERERISQVVDDLIAAEDDHEGLSWMLRQETLQEALVHPDVLPTVDPDLLAGPFAHVVVDEAQELTDAEWQMLIRRCPSRSFTIVGDRAQARHGFTDTWQQRLKRIGLDRVTVASLTINYRTPEEVMAEAEPVIRAAIPEANVPTSVRASGLPVVHGHRSQLGAIVDEWMTTHADGIACVIGDPAFEPTARVASLTPELAKGLEFDLVVLVDAPHPNAGIEGAVDRYVAMTRATQQLVILTGDR
ncbi:MAG TPA: RNA polymerase recycling motor ATPase HelR, partial [Pseudolysinimonas sp.]